MPSRLRFAETIKGRRLSLLEVVLRRLSRAGMFQIRHRASILIASRANFRRSCLRRRSRMRKVRNHDRRESRCAPAR